MTEVVEGDPTAGSEATADSGERLVDHLDPRVVNILTALGFIVPVAAYLLFISHFSVNVIYQDQWSDISVIQRSYSHGLDWSSLWAQHNENRIFFPNLIVIVLAHTTQYNVHAEEVLSGLMLVVSMLLVIWAHKRRSPTKPWLYYCPVLILGLSVVQYGAALWGFQLAWYVVLLALVIALVLLDRPTLTWLMLFLAAGAAVVGSFSSNQGLLIWPTGLVLLYCRHRRVRYALAWMAIGALTTALYLYNFDTNAGSVFPSALTIHSISPVVFATFAIGDVLGVPIQFGGHNYAILGFGILIVALALLTVVIYGIRRDERSASPFGVALICFGLLFAGLVGKGRSPLGYWAASSSGYTIYDLLIPIGIYLALLGRSSGNRSSVTSEHDTSDRPERRAMAIVTWMERRMPPVIGGLLVVIVLLQVALGIGNGLRGARTIQRAELKAAYTARHVDQASDLALLDDLNFSRPPSVTRRQAHLAEALHLSLYADGRQGPRPPASHGHH